MWHTHCSCSIGTKIKFITRLPMKFFLWLIKHFVIMVSYVFYRFIILLSFNSILNPRHCLILHIQLLVQISARLNEILSIHFIILIFHLYVLIWYHIVNNNELCNFNSDWMNLVYNLKKRHSPILVYRLITNTYL